MIHVGLSWYKTRIIGLHIHVVNIFKTKNNYMQYKLQKYMI